MEYPLLIMKLTAWFCLYTASVSAHSTPWTHWSLPLAQPRSSNIKTICENQVVEEKESGGPVSCHVLDTSVGKPGVEINVTFVRLGPAPADSRPGEGCVLPVQAFVQQTTDSDGRAAKFMTDDQFTAGTYRAHFATKKYFEERGVKSHYPYVEITFDVADPSAHYHIGLLITPWGYTTYRGS